MAQLLSVMLALSPSLMVDSRDVLGLGEVKHVMAGEEYNVRQQLSQVRAMQYHQVHPPLMLTHLKYFRESENQSLMVCAAKCQPINTRTACLRVRTPGASMTTPARTSRRWPTCPSPSPSTRARSSWWSTWPPSEVTPRSTTLSMHWQSVMRTSLSKY